MSILSLKYSEVVHGDFEVKDKNLLFVFQINCPGCLLHGLPLVHRLQELYGDELNVLGLSTAFENYDLNSLSNTERLVHNQELVGHSSEAFAQQGMKKYPEKITIPVAMDLVDPDYISEENIQAICQLHPAYTTWPAFEQGALHQKVKAYLQSLDSISHTFTTNQLRGTPSFILFDNHMRISKKWFGHEPEDKVHSTIELFLEKS